MMFFLLKGFKAALISLMSASTLGTLWVKVLLAANGTLATLMSYRNSPVFIHSQQVITHLFKKKIMYEYF